MNSAPQDLKDSTIDCEFYVKIWKMLKSKDFDEIVPKAGASIIETLRKI